MYRELITQWKSVTRYLTVHDRDKKVKEHDAGLEATLFISISQVIGVKLGSAVARLHACCCQTTTGHFLFQVQQCEWSLICDEVFVVKLEFFIRPVSDF